MGCLGSLIFEIFASCGFWGLIERLIPLTSTPLENYPLFTRILVRGALFSVLKFLEKI